MLKERHPWSPDDLVMLADLIADGYPAKSIAAQLGRTTTAVIGMAKKTGARIQRGKTRAFQVQVDLAAYDAMVAIARTRRVTPNTMVRIAIELLAKNPAFVTLLFDDADRHLEDDEPAMVRAAPIEVNVSKPVAPVDIAVPSLSAALQPQFVLAVP